jgi:hypothetical protein
MSLDDVNTDVVPDAGGCRGTHAGGQSAVSACHPYRRTTGIHLKLAIEYSNLDNNGKVAISNNKARPAPPLAPPHPDVRASCCSERTQL